MSRLSRRWNARALYARGKRAVSLWRAAAAANVRAAAAGSPVYGLPALYRLEQLAVRRPLTLAGGQSSYERDTQGESAGNDDRDNFLYVSGGEKVMLDQAGPGTVYRIWVTGFDAATAWLRVYFDGESSPRINLLLRELFSGTRSPFLSPLVADNTRSSGGFVCYLPLPYQRSIKITTNLSGYYDVGYHTFSPDTAVTTWTGGEDSSAARSAWSNAGADPKDPSGTSATTRNGGLGAEPAPGARRLEWAALDCVDQATGARSDAGEGGDRSWPGAPRVQPVPRGDRPGQQRGDADPADGLRHRGPAGAGAGRRGGGGGVVRPRLRSLIPVARQQVRAAARR